MSWSCPLKKIMIDIYLFSVSQCLDDLTLVSLQNQLFTTLIFTSYYYVLLIPNFYNIKFEDATQRLDLQPI